MLGAGVSVQPQVSLGVILDSYCSGKLAVFTVLCEQYQPSLRRDPMYNEVRLLHLAEAPHLGSSLEEGAERAAPAGPCGWVHLLTYCPASCSTSTGLDSFSSVCRQSRHPPMEAC